MRIAHYGIAALTAVLLLAPWSAEARRSSARQAKPPQAQAFTAEAVDSADFKSAPNRSQASPLALKIQVYLARAHASPGQIDGVYGASSIQAIKNFQTMQGLDANGKLTRELWDKLREMAGAMPVTMDYEITPADVKGPFAEKIPDDYKEKAALKSLAYTSPVEGLAEKFHMAEALLRSLNPGKGLDQAGEHITVIDTGPQLDGRIERVEVDAGASALRVYGPEGKALAIYPATVGSKDTPSPSGSLKVRGVTRNPTYYYDPKKLNFAGVNTDRELKIAPGPNNPVGVVWIDLDKPTYGIHGTPDPENIGKTSSHGCVRLTNWDAEELAGLVKKGTPVEFVNAETASTR